jgi:redox-sensitive bicupin YhaK (pirin superfamily)
MTSGRGIAHSEESPVAARPALLHGVQLWIALPKDKQFTEPGFAHHADLPVLELPAAGGPSGSGGAGEAGARVTVVVGEFGGVRSPAAVHTPLVGLEVSMPAAGNVIFATREDFEYGVVAADGPASVQAGGAAGTGRSGEPGVTGAGARIEPGMLAHLSAGNAAIQLSAAGPNRFFVVGGAPLGERLIMWWNFVARSADEIASARESWIARDDRFGEVRGYAGHPLPAPPLPPGIITPR